MFSRRAFWKFFGPVLEFLVFFTFCAFVVLSADAVCYLVKHKWPTTHVSFGFSRRLLCALDDRRNVAARRLPVPGLRKDRR